MDLNAILRIAVELGASDIHLKVDQPPMLRTDGAIAPFPDCPALNEQNLLAALEAVTRVTPERLRQFHETGDLDLAYTAEGLPRFRVNVFRQRGAISFALRVIPKEVPSFEKLSLPPGVARLANESDRPTLAIDIPSGIDGATGDAAGPAVCADLTVCFAALKPGVLFEPGRSHAGRVEVVDIRLHDDGLVGCARWTGRCHRVTDEQPDDIGTAGNVPASGAKRLPPDSHRRLISEPGRHGSEQRRTGRGGQLEIHSAAVGGNVLE